MATQDLTHLGRTRAAGSDRRNLAEIVRGAAAAIVITAKLDRMFRSAADALVTIRPHPDHQARGRPELQQLRGSILRRPPEQIFLL